MVPADKKLVKTSNIYRNITEVMNGCFGLGAEARQRYSTYTTWG